MGKAPASYSAGRVFKSWLRNLLSSLEIVVPQAFHGISRKMPQIMPELPRSASFPSHYSSMRLWVDARFPAGIIILGLGSRTPNLSGSNSHAKFLLPVSQSTFHFRLRFSEWCPYYALWCRAVWWNLCEASVERTASIFKAKTSFFSLLDYLIFDPEN
jgi:hypothetical protein